MTTLNENVCGLCHSEQSKYTCPRCNINYCSLNCYKGPQHVNCSETFYQTQFNQELHNHRAPEGSKNKMLEMLRRLDNEDKADEYNEHLLHYPMAEEEDNCQQNDQDEEELLDSDDDDDLENRMAGIDLDDADAVWSRLTSDERRQFRQLMTDGDLTAVLPPYDPWWNSDDGSSCVVELEDEEFNEIIQESCNKKQEAIIKEDRKNSIINIDASSSHSENLESLKLDRKHNDDQAIFNKETSKINQNSSTLNKAADSLEVSNKNSTFDNNCIHISSNNSINDSISNNTGDLIINTKSSTNSSYLSKHCKPPSSISSSKYPTSVTTISKPRRIPDARVAISGIPTSVRRLYADRCPQPTAVHSLSQLRSGPVSPLLRYNIVNTAVSYVWLMTLYHGDHEDRPLELTEGLLLLSDALSGRLSALTDFRPAMAGVTINAMQHPWLSSPPPPLASLVSILTGPRQAPGYFLHLALSDSLRQVKRAKQEQTAPLVEKATTENSKTKITTDSTTSGAATFISDFTCAQQNVEIRLSTPKQLTAVVAKLQFYLAFLEHNKTELVQEFRQSMKLIQLEEGEL